MLFASRRDQRRRRQRARRLRMRTQPLILLVPNIFTVMALCAGLTSIRFALDARFELAVGLVVLAGILDGLDGRSARLLRIQSSFGAQLDSLADFLSFGVAPAMLVYLWSLNQVKGLGWLLALLFATCCALRLARFNTELDEPDQPAWKAHFFTGMPAPAGAGCVMIPILLALALDAAWPQAFALNAAFTVVVALMMVSRVPTYSVKRIRVNREFVLPTLLFFGLLVAALATEPWLTLAAVGAIYLASLPFAVLAARRLRRHEAAAGPAPAPDAQGGPEQAAMAAAGAVPDASGDGDGDGRRRIVRLSRQGGGGGEAAPAAARPTAAGGRPPPS